MAAPVGGNRVDPRRPGNIWLLITAAFCLLCAATPGKVQAQPDAPAWSAPVNLSNMLTNSAYPQVVAGPDGLVHVFWSENLPDYSTFNNVIYYTRLEELGWSQPVDILISPQGLEAKADQPAAVVGSDGRLHVVFVGGYNGQIYYSSADTHSALNARAWLSPLLLSADIEQVEHPNILEDPNGTLHVLFTCIMGGMQGIYHTTSADRGLTWSRASLIPSTPLGTDTILTETRSAISPAGVLHVTWTWSNLDLYPPKGIFYVRSDDHGATWSEIESVVEGPYSYSDVAVSGENDVVMTWSGTLTDRHKFFRSSNDGGLTWSAATRIATLGGLQGYSGMAVDSRGVLHLSMAASCFALPVPGEVYSGDALVYSAWNGSGFLPAVPLLKNTVKENNVQYADIAISQGNIAHLVVMYPVYTAAGLAGEISKQSYNFEIYYLSATLNAPHLPAAASTSTDSRQPPGERAATSAVRTPTTRPVQHWDETIADPTGIQITPTISILIGAAPAAFILAVVLWVRKNLWRE